MDRKTKAKLSDKEAILEKEKDISDVIKGLAKKMSISNFEKSY